MGESTEERQKNKKITVKIKKRNKYSCTVHSDKRLKNNETTILRIE
jgi:hypothetical protein